MRIFFRSSAKAPSKRQNNASWQLTHRIFLGLGLGLLTGLTLGERTENIRFVGEVYVGLMQMTVLPYVVFSLVGNIGRLSPRQVRLLASSGIKVFLGLWFLSAVTVVVLSTAFPGMEGKQWFSAALIETPARPNWMSLFIPSNPFRALADNSVPAVVIFCILFGVALNGFEEKSSFLEHIHLITRALHRVNGFVVQLTPFGVFGISAYSAGTMTIAEFGRLQGYYLVFSAAVLLLSFVVLPLIVSVMTPFSWRQTILASKDAVLTAFVTGSVFPVIPLLVEGVERLFEPHLSEESRASDYPEFILPLAYPFPDAGNVVDLLFIPFAGWYLGQVLGLADHLYMVGTGFFLLFGKVFLTLPFLLNSFKLPQDMFQLFLAAGVLAARIGDVLSSMHYLVFTLLTTAAMTGLLKIRWRKLMILMLGLLVLLSGASFGLRYLLKHLPEDTRNITQSLEHRVLLNPGMQSSKILLAEPNSQPLASGQNRLDRIRKRKCLRVGFRPDNLPYSYFNQEGQLVGIDIELATRLAEDLGVQLELIPFHAETLSEQLAQDHFDLALSGLTESLERSSTMLMTDPYMVVSLALVVRDFERKDYESEPLVKQRSPLRLGVVRGSYFEKRIRIHFPEAELVVLDSPRPFFEDSTLRLDALVLHAESGAAWTLLYPAYTVINPLRHKDSAPLAIAVAGFDVVLEDTLNTWIRLLRMDGTLDRLVDHWILGRDLREKPRRWNLLDAYGPARFHQTETELNHR